MKNQAQSTRLRILNQSRSALITVFAVTAALQFVTISAHADERGSDCSTHPSEVLLEIRSGREPDLTKLSECDMPKLSCFGTVPGQPLSLEKFHNKMHVGFDRALPPPNKMKFCIETWWAQCMSIFSGAGTADHFFSGEVYWPSLDSAEARQRIIKDQSALIEVGGTKLEFRQYCNDVETPAIKSLDYAKAQSEQRNAQWKIDHPNGWKPEGHRERGDGGGYDPGDDGRSQADDQGSGDGSSGAASSIQDPDAVIKAITDKINGQKPSNNPGAAVSPVKPAPPRVSSQGIAQPGSSGSSVIAAPAGNGAGANSAPAQVKLRPVAPKPQAPRAQKSSGSSEPLLPPI